jgi:hypothetical protein
MSLDLNELMQEAERLEKKGGSFLDNFVPMPPGDGAITVRLLPARKGQKFQCMTRTHRLGKYNLHCPRELNKEGRWVGVCPICDEYNGLWRQSEVKGCPNVEELQNKARSIKPIERYYLNCIIRTLVLPNNEVQRNVGPKILSVGKTVWKMIVRAIVGDAQIDEKPLGDVTDIKSGRDFKIVKTMVGGSSGTYPQYHLSKFLDPSPLGNPDECEKWLGSLHDLYALRVLKPTSDLQHALDVFLGKIEDTDQDYESPEEIVTTTSKASSPKVETPKIETAVDQILADEDFYNDINTLKVK